MTRLILATFAGAALVLVYNRAAGTGWAIPLAVVAFFYAVLVWFLDERSQRQHDDGERAV